MSECKLSLKYRIFILRFKTSRVQITFHNIGISTAVSKCMTFVLHFKMQEFQIKFQNIGIWNYVSKCWNFK